MPNSIMRLAATCSVFALACTHTATKTPPESPVKPIGVALSFAVAHDSASPDIEQLASRLDLEKYKATVKGLTQFGDRRQGTDRNRAAVDWIEAQLKSYGCPTERIIYQFKAPPPRQPGAAPAGGRGGNQAQGGGRLRGNRNRTGVNTDSTKQPD
ncbi:MAG TPA: hypothetical protein VGJ12_02465, partial [Gemmatimonadaceae bacterium]